ncbi:hypothetical protein LPJ53_003690 [Coemansia erecta]|uniref:Homeobox domain-containing protein n=1 Tax=Coemansia erecta TaxID=147472 RepID=A0A9W7Y052_9FUNG|nr:hypothetical protein LPJ53_003690 [Coemansia erecta]
MSNMAETRSVTSGRNADGNSSTGSSTMTTSRYSQIVIKEPNTAEPKKAKRKRISPEQLKELTAVFDKTDTPTHDIREELSKKLNMTNREVQVWFQNRRAKYNRMRIEQQRQIRNNAAIIYSANMAVRAPMPVPPLQLQPQIHSAPPAPAQLTPASVSYTHMHTHAQQNQYAHSYVRVPTTNNAPEPASRSYIEPVVSTGDISSVSKESPYISIGRSGGQSLRSLQSPPTDRSHLAGTIAFDATASSAASTMLSMPRSPVQHQGTSIHSSERSFSNAIYGEDAQATSPAVGAYHQSMNIVLHQHDYRTDLAPPQLCRSPFSPILTSSAPQSAGTLECPSSAARLSSSPYSQHAPGVMHLGGCRGYDSHLAPRHPNAPRDDCSVSGAHVHVTRRNTVSSYNPNSSGDGILANGHSPLLARNAMSPPLSTLYGTAADARTRYTPKTPIGGYHYHRRLSAHRSPSPPKYCRHHNPWSPDMQGNSAQMQTATATRQSALPCAALSSRQIRLPSIQTLLAGARVDIGKRPSADGSSAGNATQLPLQRARSYTSPPIPQGGDQAPTDVHVIPANGMTGTALQGAHPSSPHGQSHQDSQIREAKMGIDVLATAAISVSSGKSSGSLPHLTPLSEFSLRNVAGQQPSLTAPASPHQTQDESSTYQPAKSTDGVGTGTRSRRVTPTTNSREKTPHSWRP